MTGSHVGLLEAPARGSHVGLLGAPAHGSHVGLLEAPARGLFNPTIRCLSVAGWVGDWSVYL